MTMLSQQVNAPSPAVWLTAVTLALIMVSGSTAVVLARRRRTA
jgi:ABC-type phosphate transport system auxiliary subunit